jgi:hypothetical protein
LHQPQAAAGGRHAQGQDHAPGVHVNETG